MFRKTIAVLLMLSIVLSSCGKKDKDKSNDFVRVVPESPASSSSSDSQSSDDVRVIPKPPSSCIHLQSLCFETLHKSFPGSVRCEPADINCVNAMTLNDSEVLRRCSPAQRDCFGYYKFPPKNNSISSSSKPPKDDSTVRFPYSKDL